MTAMAGEIVFYAVIIGVAGFFCGYLAAEADRRQLDRERNDQPPKTMRETHDAWLVANGRPGTRGWRA